MTIEDVVNLWKRSKYNQLFLRTEPCINHLGELTYGTCIYRKDQTIIADGEERTIYDYLLKRDKNLIYMFDESLSNDTSLGFKVILNINKNKLDASNLLRWDPKIPII